MARRRQRFSRTRRAAGSAGGYRVTIRIPDRPIEHKDVVFTVRKSGTQFGRLKVSKGSLVWLPGKKSKGFRLVWQQIDRLARETGRRGVFPV